MPQGGYPIPPAELVVGPFGGEFIAMLTDEEVADLLCGQPNTGVANTFGIGNLGKYGVPNAMIADGPAGLRIRQEVGVCTTAWPCATLLACTWNQELAEEVGAAGAACRAGALWRRSNTLLSITRRQTVYTVIPGFPSARPEKST